MKWLWTSWKVGWGSPRPAAAALGPMCSWADLWNASADSHTSSPNPSLYKRPEAWTLRRQAHAATTWSY